MISQSYDDELSLGFWLLVETHFSSGKAKILFAGAQWKGIVSNMKLAQLVGMVLLVFSLSSACYGISLKEDGYHVFPGDNLQDALQEAAHNNTNKVIKVHAGEYRPNGKRQALIWFNRVHDGIR